MAETPENPITAPGNARLTPLDEAYVAHADALSELAHEILQNYPLKPRTAAAEPGTFLKDALDLRRLADVVVQRAVIVERERGASWADIGAAASTTKQTAHERWGTVVGGWNLLHRRHASRFGSAHLAHTLDRWYAELYPGEEFAITSGLAAVDPRNAVEQEGADAERSEAWLLQIRLTELQTEGTDAYNATFTALDDRQARVAALRRWEDVHTSSAEVYERLAQLQPTLADEHLSRAAKQREMAARINAQHAEPQAAAGPDPQENEQ
ncbi:hypothetical protein [Kitasatospora sp. HPMI-4]|uniref:hypothetical protein n=1 Tax=Kitasatospora sp. HPMI-4 TaxID=3448443 RepID=UPI003F1C11E0